MTPQLAAWAFTGLTAVVIAFQLALAARGQLSADPGLSLLLAREAIEATAERGYVTE